MTDAGSDASASDAELEGGGVSCAVSTGGASKSGLLYWLAGLAALMLLRRRR